MGISTFFPLWRLGKPSLPLVFSLYDRFFFCPVFEASPPHTPFRVCEEAARRFLEVGSLSPLLFFAERWPSGFQPF